MFKRICIFTGLKIAEIGSIGSIYYLLCKLTYSTKFFGGAPFWLCGFLAILLIIFICLITVLFYVHLEDWVKKNWEWAKKISSKF